MSLSGGSRVMAVLAVVATIAALPASAPAAIAYETAPPFCQERTLVDYLASPRGMPKLRAFPASRRLGFTSGNIRFGEQVQPVLYSSPARLGYRLGLSERGDPPVRLGWTIETWVSRVDKRGRLTQRLLHAKQHAGVVTHRHGIGAAAELPSVGIYRLDVVIRGAGGRKLARFGSFHEVVGPTADARLVLNASTYRAGTTVWAQIENYGTEPVHFGVPWSVEKQESGSWALAPESPRGPWIMPRLSALPGTTARNCVASFGVPPTMPPGRYRIVKEIEYEISGETRYTGKDQMPLYAEFDVVP